jgi:hypothetical protein
MVSKMKNIRRELSDQILDQLGPLQKELDAQLDELPTHELWSRLRTQLSRQFWTLLWDRIGVK